MRRNTPTSRDYFRASIGLAMLLNVAIVAAQQPSTDKGASGKQPGRSSESATAKQAGMNADTVRIMRLKRLTLSGLNLAPEKARKICKMFDEHLASMRKQRTAAPSSPAENSTQMKELDGQIAKARAAGDRQALGKLASRRRQLESGGQPGMDHAHLRDSILAELDASQSTQFMPMYQDAMQPRGQRAGGGLRGLQSLRKTLETLQLSPEQKKATDDLFKQLKPGMRKAREQGREAVTRIVEGFKKEILALLTAEQRAAFEKAEQSNSNQRGVNGQKNRRGGQRSKGRQAGQSRSKGQGKDGQPNPPN